MHRPTDPPIHRPTDPPTHPFHPHSILMTCQKPRAVGNKFGGRVVRGARVILGTSKHARYLMRLNQLHRIQSRQSKPFILQFIMSIL